MGCCPSKEAAAHRKHEAPLGAAAGATAVASTNTTVSWNAASLPAYGELPILTKQASAMLRQTLREMKIEAISSVDGPVVQMIESGSIALVRGKYLMHLAETGQPIPRRQDAPPQAFWPREEAARRFRQSAEEVRRKGPDLAGLLFLGLFLVAFSYCWITSNHPDPHCFHLRRIADILRAMAKLRKGYDTFDDVGVFWDYLSLHQHSAHSNARRSDVENDHFKLALSGMQYIYAHDLVCIIKLKHMPPCPHELGPDRRFEATIDGEKRRLGWHYADRGWPTFESSVANLSRAVQWSRLAFDKEALELDGKAPQTLNPPLLLDFRHKHVANDPPVHPRTLAALLGTRSFASGADHAVVLDLYERTFAKLCEAKQLHFCTFTWSLEMCTHFAEAIAAYEHLEVFSLVDGNLGEHRVRQSADPACLKALLATLASRPRLQHARYHDMRASTECIQLFCSHLPPSVTSLALPENPLRDTCAYMLAELLPTQTPNLKHLDFKGNYTGQVQFSNKAKAALQAALPRVTIDWPARAAAPAGRPFWHQ